MAIPRTATWLAAVAITIALAGTSQAQKFNKFFPSWLNSWSSSNAPPPADVNSIQPFGPGLATLDNQPAAPFAPFDGDQFGAGPPEYEGLFFAYDRLYWALGEPRTSLLGIGGSRVVNDGVTTFTQVSSVDTSRFDNEFEWGNRWEGGYVVDEHGWLASAFSLGHQTQALSAQDVSSIFIIPTVMGVPLLDDSPITFTDVSAVQTSHLESYEISKIHRLGRFHDGAYAELYFGVRYIQLRDHFDLAMNGGVLSDTTNQTDTDNDILGPQIGGRWFVRHGDWRLETEARFSPAINFQKVRQRAFVASNGVVGTNIEFDPVEVLRTHSREEFAPVVELRVQTSYQFTRNVALRLNWTGMYIDGVARSSNQIVYTLPTMGISGYSEDLFVHGVGVGFEINH